MTDYGFYQGRHLHRKDQVRMSRICRYRIDTALRSRPSCDYRYRDEPYWAATSFALSDHSASDGGDGARGTDVSVFNYSPPSDRCNDPLQCHHSDSSHYSNRHCLSESPQ